MKRNGGEIRPNQIESTQGKLNGEILIQISSNQIQRKQPEPIE
jgi:hypothetical protein